MWVDYPYYDKVYKGDTIYFVDFERLVNRAQSRIDYLTLSKASNAINSGNQVVINRVKLAVCEVAEMYYRLDLKITANNLAMEKAVTRGIASETVKSHSISFNRENDFKTETQLTQEGIALIDAKIIELLLTTGLLYRGVGYV